MPFPPRQPGRLASDDLIAALRRHARDRAVDGNAAADIELSLLHFQKLATLGQMAADVARDFGNLMTAVLSYSEMMVAAAEKGELPEHEHLIELRRAAEQASALTERLLNYSRDSADQAVPLGLGRLVGGLTCMLRRLVGPTGSLAVTVDPATATVLADAGQIEQLLVNLVLNARDAIAASGRVDVAVDPVRLTAPLVHILGTAPPGDYVRLLIRDNRGATLSAILHDQRRKHRPGPDDRGPDCPQCQRRPGRGQRCPQGNDGGHFLPAARGGCRHAVINQSARFATPR